MWNTMPTEVLLERAWALSKEHQGGELVRCIDALTWRLRGSEEWIASRARSQANSMDSALRSYGERLAEMTRQHPFNTLRMGSAIVEDAGAVASHFFNALLEVLHEAGLVPPQARGTLADWFLDDALEPK